MDRGYSRMIFSLPAVHGKEKGMKALGVPTRRGIITEF